MEPPRVVLDTSVIVAGLRSRLGASSHLLALVAEERLVPLVTTALFLEYEEVLKRPEQRLATGMDEKDIKGFMAAFASAADPDDEIVLEAAVNGRSKVIVTHNVRYFEPAAGQFGLQGVTPGAFLKRINT